MFFNNETALKMLNNQGFTSSEHLIVYYKFFAFYLFIFSFTKNKYDD